MFSIFNVSVGGTDYFGLGVNPYNSDYPSQKNFTDDEGYPSTNIKFIDFELDPGSTSEGSTKIYIDDIRSGYLTYGDKSKNQIGFYTTKDINAASTFHVFILEGGAITLYDEATPLAVIMESVPVKDKKTNKTVDLKYVLMLGDKYNQIVHFHVDGFTKEEKKAISQ